MSFKIVVKGENIGEECLYSSNGTGLRCYIPLRVAKRFFYKRKPSKLLINMFKERYPPVLVTIDYRKNGSIRVGCTLFSKRVVERLKKEIFKKSAKEVESESLQTER